MLNHWTQLRGGRAVPFGTGLINRTFRVDGPGGRFVLQQLHPVFAGVVNEDLEAVTEHLARKGLVTPRLVRASDGATFVPDDQGRPWRAITWVEGGSVDTVSGPSLAREAGRLVGAFHAAVDDLEWSYRHVRAGVHETARHRATLIDALEVHRGHRLYEEASRLAERLMSGLEACTPLEGLPLRHAHGDLKLSNLLFDSAGRGLCLVDLDTLGRMAWAHEMGDALRSWCNPAGEDSVENGIDLGVFDAAVAGYATSAATLLTSAERETLVTGVQTICLELSARFLADALNESYFGWNASRYPARGEHNLARARGQLTLGESVARQRAALESVVARAFARPR